MSAPTSTRSPSVPIVSTDVQDLIADRKRLSRVEQSTDSTGAAKLTIDTSYGSLNVTVLEREFKGAYEAKNSLKEQIARDLDLRYKSIAGIVGLVATAAIVIGVLFLTKESMANSVYPLVGKVALGVGGILILTFVYYAKCGARNAASNKAREKCNKKAFEYCQAYATETLKPKYAGSNLESREARDDIEALAHELYNSLYIRLQPKV